MVRQKNLKVLVAEADARWAAKPSFLDAPGKARGQPLPVTVVKDPGGYVQRTEPLEERVVGNTVRGGLGDKVQGMDIAFEEVIEKEKSDRTGRRHFNGPLEEKKREENEHKEDPWKQSRGGPSEQWQPKAWDGNITATKR